MTPEQQARAEIARRRAVAQAATPGPYFISECIDATGSRLAVDAPSNYVCVLPSDDRTADAAHIAANDPAHVLRVLDAAEATLDRHAFPCPVGCVEHAHRCTTCDESCPCPDAAAVLDLYAPEATP